MWTIALIVAVFLISLYVLFKTLIAIGQFGEYYRATRYKKEIETEKERTRVLLAEHEMGLKPIEPKNNYTTSI